MPAAPLPATEAERLAALDSYAILDTACDANCGSLVRLASQLAGTPIALVSLVDRNRQWFKARLGLPAQETPRDHAFCAHAILRPGELLEVPDAMADPRFADSPLVTGETGIRFYAGMPLVTPEGHALGTLCVMDRKPRRLTGQQREMLGSLAEAVMTALELRRTVRQVHAMALSDALTGLPNRLAFRAAVARAIAARRRAAADFALIYLDLDGFKAVNDRHGHAAGDRLLRDIGRMLEAHTRPDDTLARLGGDEFAVLLVGCTPLQASQVAQRLRSAVAAEAQRQGFAVTASVGVATFEAPPESVDEAIAQADAGMYRAKHAGGDQVRHLRHSASHNLQACPGLQLAG